MTVLLANFVTCMAVRLYHSGRLIPIDDPNNTGERNEALLIAGLQNQPDTAYQYIETNGYDRVYLKFSYFGYSPKSAGKQLENLMDDGDIACGVSVGAKTIEYSNLPTGSRAILINPCSHPKVLKSPFRYLTKLSPLVEVLSYSLGWLSVLPIIPADMGQKTSFALLADELFWIGWGDPEINTTNTGVVISTEDEFLDPKTMRRTYSEALTIEIDTLHGRTGSKKYCRKYYSAINQLLKYLKRKTT